MTQTNKQIRQLESLKYTPNLDRQLREVDVAHFDNRNGEYSDILFENLEADTWAEGRYYAKS